MSRHPLIGFESSWDRDDFESAKDARWPREYNDALQEFSGMIDKRSTEPPIQTFLEQHPYLLPGLGTFHHGPYAGIVVSKFPLGNDFVTDFAFVSSNSQMLRLICVEIESARKNLFRKDGAFNRDYIDARQQIVDWLHWANQNPTQAIDCWRPLLNRKHLLYCTVQYQGFLVMGRRSDIDTRKKQERWSAEAESMSPQLGCMTYDRLIERAEWLVPRMDNDKIATCTYKDRRFQAKHITS